MSARVAKFGGTSIRDAACMNRCAKLVSQDSLLKFVVVSATAKTTNQLEEVASRSLTGERQALEVLYTIFDRHRSILHEFEPSSHEKDLFEVFLEKILDEGRRVVGTIRESGEVTPESLDWIYSFGERLSSHLFHLALSRSLSHRNVTLLQAHDFMWTNDHFLKASPLEDDIEKTLQSSISLKEDSQLFLTQGFLGITKDRRPTTFGREGSDYSAAIVGKAIGASQVQIWTDVPGIASCDPRMVEKVRWIDHLHYDEASQMAREGAKVLFPETLGPLRRGGVELKVCSSSEKRRGEGSLVSETLPEAPRVVGIVPRLEGVSLVGHEIEKLKALLETDFNKVPEIQKIESSPGVIRLWCEHSQVKKVATSLHDSLELERKNFQA